MKEKDKKSESEKKEEAHPIIADPNLDKVVLHNLLWASPQRISKQVIDSRIEELVMNLDKETCKPDKEPQTEKPSEIEVDPSLDRIVKKGLDTDKEESQK